MSNQDINPEHKGLPRHIAIIMDGNGRWAEGQGARRIFGHQNAIKAVRQTVEGCAELGIEVLTLYAFSTENWGRPAEEVEALMQLLVYSIANELPTLQKNAIRLAAIGNIEGLPDDCRTELNRAIEATQTNNQMTLVLALNYSGRWDITTAVRQLATMAKNEEIDPDQIDEQTVAAQMATRLWPDPELLIRTSGEQRISNFLLWQMAYTEIFVTPVLWPDFRKTHLIEAIEDFKKRERRFGKINTE